MGDVKEEIKGSAPKHKAKTKSSENILKSLYSIMDEISLLIVKKDEETTTEGATEKPENMRKAATLRAVHSMLITVTSLLEDY